MNIKLDENLPAGLSPLLAARGHDTQTVPQERLYDNDLRPLHEACKSLRD